MCGLIYRQYIAVAFIGHDKLVDRVCWWIPMEIHRPDEEPLRVQLTIHSTEMSIERR